MRQQKLGLQGLEVSALGLGCMGMSEFYGVRDDRESIATLHRALELGVTLLDTADQYGPFTNEELIGRAIAGHRDNVVLATKFGLVRDAASGNFTGVNGRPEYVRAACEASLKRLRAETIDLYYPHRLDPDTPVEDTVGALGQLVSQGKVRYIGLCETDAGTLRRAHAVHPISALQCEYSLWSRDPEDEMLAVCRELGIGFVAYSPLGRGFLTGQIRRLEDLPEHDARRRMPRFQNQNFQHNLEQAASVARLAAEKECTPAQLALAWVLAQAEATDTNIVPIPGAKRRVHLEQNVAALALRLNPREMRRLDEAAPPGVAAGAR